MHSTRTPTRRRVGLVVALAVSACLGAWVLRRAPLDAIGKALASASPGPVASGIALQLVVPLLSAARTQRIASSLGLPLRYGQVLHILLATNFYSLFLPGTQLSGGVISLYRYRTLGVRVPRAAVALAASRFAEASAFMAIAGWILLARVVPAWSAVAVGTAAGIALVALARLRSGTGTVVVTASAVVQVLLAALASLCFLRGLAVDLSYANTLWITAGAYLAVLLPISVAGLGVREGALVALAGPYGVSAEDAVAWGLLLFAGRVAVAVVGGLLELARLVAPPAGTGRHDERSGAQRARPGSGAERHDRPHGDRGDAA